MELRNIIMHNKFCTGWVATNTNEEQETLPVWNSISKEVYNALFHLVSVEFQGQCKCDCV